MEKGRDRDRTAEGARAVGGALDGEGRDRVVCDGEGREGEGREGEGREGETPDAELPVGPVPADLPPVTSPQRYQLQFETTEEHVQLLERAKALSARGRHSASFISKR
jgi:hypothetical protein